MLEHGSTRHRSAVRATRPTRLITSTAVVSLALAGVWVAGLSAQGVSTMDVTSLCQGGANPTAAQMSASEASVRAASLSAALASGAVRASAAGGPTSKGATTVWKRTVTADLADGRTLRTTSGTLGATSQHADRALGVIATKVAKGQTTQHDAGLTYLKRTSVWVRATSVSSTALTSAAFADAALDAAGLNLLVAPTASGLTTSYLCQVDSGGTVLVDVTVHDTATDADTVYNLALDLGSDGRLARSEVYSVHGTQHAVTTLSYAVRTVAAQSSITAVTWRAALVRGLLPTLRASTLKAAKTKVAKAKTKAKRLAALRSVAKAKAKAFTITGQPDKAAYVTVTNGARVRIKDPRTKKYVYFTLTLKGTKITTKTHL